MTNEQAKKMLKNDIEICTIQQKQACDLAIKTLGRTSYKSEARRWIPCSERNPKETGEYLTTIKWRDDKNGYNYAVVKRNYFADVETWNDSLVIAWMPLPRAYTESEG